MSTNTNTEPYLNSTEAAQMLKISTATLWKLVAQGRVPVIRLCARKMTFSRSELESLRGEYQSTENSARTATSL